MSLCGICIGVFPRIAVPETNNSLPPPQQMDYLDHQLNSMRLQSPGQAYAQPMSLNVPLTLTRNKSAPQVCGDEQLMFLSN